MDVDAELPPDLEWYKDQIAGHHPSVIRNGIRQIGILKERGRDELILKLAQDGVRGEREVALYNCVEAIMRIENDDWCRNGQEARNDDKEEQSPTLTDAMMAAVIDGKTKLFLTQLYPFLPRFYGCRRIRLVETDIPKEFLQLEDITHPFTNPCIMDIKVGRVTYDPFASEDKKVAEDTKCPSQKKFGFRILGYRIHTEMETRCKDRVWGRERDEANMQEAFEEYLVHARPEVALHVLDGFLERLGAIRDWFERQTILHFYASSVLLVYEGHSNLPPVVDIRMIDFSHVFRADYGQNGSEWSVMGSKDDNYLYGLVRIIDYFHKIRADLLERIKVIGSGENSERPDRFQLASGDDFCWNHRN